MNRIVQLLTTATLCVPLCSCGPSRVDMLFHATKQVRPEMTLAQVTNLLPPGSIQKTEPCTYPLYTGTTLIHTNVEIATALFARGEESMLNGAPVPDKTIIYFTPSNIIAGLDFSSYLSRKDRWHPDWGVVVDVYCDGRPVTKAK